MKQQSNRIVVGLALATVVVASAGVLAQAGQITQRPGVPPELASKLPPSPLTTPEPAYLIGPDDVLVVTVWRQPEVSGDVIVRPDGKITMPVGNDIVASGLTTEELKKKVIEELGRFYNQPDVFIQVKAIKSRQVFITGAVGKPGPYPLTGPMTVNQLITTAGGVTEFADKKNIMLISGTLKGRDGGPLAYKINYEDIMKGKNLAKYNVELRPGDQIIVRGGL